MKVRVGTTEVSYAVKDGDTQDDVVKGLNAAFASAGFQLQATDTGSRRADRDEPSTATPPSFDVDWTASGYATHAGQDVQGTINGVVATGSGQQLMARSPTARSSGLAIKITGTADRRPRQLHLHAAASPSGSRPRSRTRPT